MNTCLRCFVLAFACVSLSGCIGPPYQQESDWRWQQMNPNYQPPHHFRDERGGW